MCAVLARRRGRRSVAWTVASPSTPSHWWTHTTTFVGRGSVAFIVTMVTASWRTRQKSGKWENVKITPVIKQGEVNTEICRANYIGHSTTSLPLCGGPNLHNRLNLNVPSLKWLLTHIGCRSFGLLKFKPQFPQFRANKPSLKLDLDWILLSVWD